jgi:chitin disaccharide deacetylase
VKRLVVTADDFGLCAEVNEAVRRAHRDGVLTCASLMVGADAAAEAAAIARADGLPVGLHLTLVEGRPVLPPERVPALVDGAGRFRSGAAGLGARLAVSRQVRAQVAAECEAQVRAFLETGLALDHVNAHHHLHVHPWILGVVLGLARRYRIPAVRVPWQPGVPPAAQVLSVMAMAPWTAVARLRLRAAGIVTNDALFGLHETGALTEAAWLGVIPRVRPGVTEVYCHPATATRGVLRETMRDYRHAEELAALLSPVVGAALERARIRRVSFAEASG